MTAALAHRGPDGDTQWCNPSGNVLFGHRRLSIIDLSENGSQAMHYLNRYTIIYNGEIYNYPELKLQLQKKGYDFKSNSDTEVILAAFDCYKMNCLDLFDGMFSFALWDEQQQLLFAARDRFGEKPFFYFHDIENNVLWFASEIKALTAGGIKTSIDPQRLLLYLSLGHTEDTSDSGGTFYKAIRQLPPAHSLKYFLPEKKIEVTRYWKLDKRTQIVVEESVAIDKFNDLLETSIARRLRSDVPLGTSLSGGLDSSAVSAYIHDQKNATIPRPTFSAIFPGFEKDESAFIQKVTAAYGLDNFAVTPTPEEFTMDFEKLMLHHEEPVSSASVYIQYRVFKLAKDHGVKVLLDGQGADETLAGYGKYIHWYLQELLNQRRLSHFRMERKALRAHNILYEWTWKNYAASGFAKLTKRHLEKKARQSLKNNNDLHSDFLNQNINGTVIIKPQVSKLNDILYFNTCQSGLTELLRYADRNSMAHGRELRLPFLNHELVEFIFSLPSHFKIHKGWTKWILRKAVEKKLPAEIVWRKDKIGFEPPQKKWMEHSLVQDYIHESKKILFRNGVLRATVLNKKNQPHDAYAADNFDWRYLVAGRLLNTTSA